MKISHRLGLAILTASLLLSGVSYYASRSHYVSLKESIEVQQKTRVRSLMDEIDWRIHARVADWRSYAGNRLVQHVLRDSNATFANTGQVEKQIKSRDVHWRNDDESGRKLIDEILSCPLSRDLQIYLNEQERICGFRVYGEAFVTNAFGANVAMTNLTTDFRQDDEEWWQKTKRLGTLVSDVAYDESAGVFSTDICIRIDDEEGTFVGTLKAALDIQEVIETVRRRSLPNSTATLTLFDADSDVIFSTQQQPLAFSPDQINEWNEDSDGVMSSIFDDGQGAQYLMTIARSRGYGQYDGLNWKIMVEDKTREVFAPVTRLSWLVFGTSMFSIATMIVMGGIFASSFTRRIQQLSDAAEEIGSGNLEHHCPVGRRDEIGMLAVHFNDMAEKLLLQTRETEQLALVATYTDNAVVITDESCRISWVNLGFTRITGYTLEEVHSRVYGTFMLGKHTNRATVAVMREALGHQMGFDVELLNYSKDGSAFWSAIEMRPIRDDAGQVTKYIAIQTDISARKEAEAEREKLIRERLQAQTEVKQLARFPDENPHPTMRVHFDGTLMYANRASRTVLQFWGIETGKPVPQPVLGELERHKLPETTKNSFEFAVGSLVFDFVIVAVHDNQYMNLYGRDITERRQAEIELERLSRRLVDASRQAGMAEMATGVLHNVGNVLNSVNVSANLVSDRIRSSSVKSLRRASELICQNEADLGTFVTAHPQGKNLATFIKRLAEKLTREQKQYNDELETLRKNVEHINEIIAVQQDYANVSGLQQVVDPLELLEDALNAIGDSLQTQEIEVQREYGTLPSLVVDKHKALQILVNILSNARDALRESNQVKRILTARIFELNGYAIIEVSDNGIGISKANLAKMFEHGFSTKHRGHGFGLHCAALAAKSWAVRCLGAVMAAERGDLSTQLTAGVGRRQDNRRSSQSFGGPTHASLSDLAFRFANDETFLSRVDQARIFTL